MTTELIILIVALVLILIAYIIHKVRKLGLKETVIHFIVEAETIYEQGKNNEKFQHVFDAFYNSLPFILQLVLTESTIDRFIQNVFDSIKEALDYRPEEQNILPDAIESQD